MGLNERLLTAVISDGGRLLHGLSLPVSQWHSQNMKMIFLFIVSFVIAGCNSKTEDVLENAGNKLHESPESASETQILPRSKSQEMAENNDEKPQKKVLDLSLPEAISFEESNSEAVYAEPPSLFDNKDLFDQKKKNVSVKALPSLKPGEKLTDMPSIDGGSVEMTIEFE
jgi:hypothetical protein